MAMAKFPEPTPLAGYKKQPGDVPVLIEGQAEGAIPNGRRIVKVRGDPGDANSVGTYGRVLASHRAGDKLGYFIEWDTFPGMPVFVADWKIDRA